MSGQDPGVHMGNFRTQPSTAHLLAPRGDRTALRALLTKSARRLKTVNLALCDEHGRTPLAIAAERGHLPVVKLLCRQCDRKADINAVDFDGRSPLLLAAMNGHAHLLEYLLRQDGLQKYQNDYFRGSPISWAVVNGHEDVVRVLLEYKQESVNSIQEIDLNVLPNINNGNVNTRMNTHRSGFSLLALAYLHNHTSIVSYLLTRPEICIGESDFEDAARSDRADILRLLLEHHQHTEHLFRTDVVWDLLPYAARFGSTSVVRCLVTEYSVPVDIMDRYTRTAIQRAILGGFEDCARVLIGMGADLTQRDDDGRSLLQLAKEGPDAGNMANLLEGY